MIEAAVAKATAPLLERISALEAQLAKAKKNSSNSSKPPSSDLVKPPKPPRKDGQHRQRGGQPGHEQHLRTDFPPEAIDEVVPYTLDCCPDCGGKLRPFEPRRRFATGGNRRRADDCHGTPRECVLVSSLSQVALCFAAGSGREGGAVRPAPDGAGGLYEGRVPCLVFHDPQVPPRCGRSNRLPQLPGQTDR